MCVGAPSGKSVEEMEKEIFEQLPSSLIGLRTVFDGRAEAR
jgi:hypothetical protein